MLRPPDDPRTSLHTLTPRSQSTALPQGLDKHYHPHPPPNHNHQSHSHYHPYAAIATLPRALRGGRASLTGMSHICLAHDLMLTRPRSSVSTLFITFRRTHHQQPTSTDLDHKRSGGKDIHTHMHNTLWRSGFLWGFELVSPFVFFFFFSFLCVCAPS